MIFFLKPDDPLEKPECVGRAPCIVSGHGVDECGQAFEAAHDTFLKGRKVLIDTAAGRRDEDAGRRACADFRDPFEAGRMDRAEKPGALGRIEWCRAFDSLKSLVFAHADGIRHAGLMAPEGFEQIEFHESA
jgi:hypothetical protein